ncbi:putative C-_U-editing enzyme APOBEC-4 [Megalops cyprinoides]|uniref:putative C->U-editing enzyme APOBEC-4 n=1 Tax=Megalops cyprinoides TaxID=118141 RepID=UPI00186421EC|nr:putative C->U-editing enzyme APOBEC-4 [Megalops cyprinoides]
MWGQVSDATECSHCPHHVRTGTEAPVSFSEFCEAFGFPAGPSGSHTLLLFYELRGPGGAVVQSGRASGCPRLRLHPETLLFASEGYLPTVLEAGEEVSYIMLYSNYTPCQELPSMCASVMVAFMEQHPWVRLDLLFSQLYHTQQGWPCSRENQAGLRSLAALWPRVTLSPISGGTWGQLLHLFVRDTALSAPQPPPMPGRVAADRLNAVQISAITGVGPAFLDLPPEKESDYQKVSQAPPPCVKPLTLLPPPHLHTSIPYGLPPQEPPASRAPYHVEPPASRARPRPVNVVRHVRLPPPGPGRPESSRSSSPSSSLCTLLLPGRPVEVLQVTERELPISQSQRNNSRKGRSQHK